MPTPTEIESARRVLKAIQDLGRPSQEDALALRMWASPSTRMRSLEEIARDILTATDE
jgi:hypothetical protein